MNGLDPASVAKVAKLRSFSTFLTTFLNPNLEQACQQIVAASQGNMNWKNGTGALADSITYLPNGTMNFLIGSDLPYARRREFGFSGMTDSLGRYYPDDPGAHFLSQALSDNTDAVMQFTLQAVQSAISTIAG